MVGLTTVVPALREAGVGESLEAMSSTSAWAIQQHTQSLKKKIHESPVNGLHCPSDNKLQPLTNPAPAYTNILTSIAFPLCQYTPATFSALKRQTFSALRIFKLSA